MDTDGGNSESRQHDRVFLHSFIVLDSLVQAQDSPGRVVGPSVEIHQGMVMDGAFMAEKMAVFLAMASMASMGKIMENLHIPRWQLIDRSLCGRCVLPFPI